MVGLVLSSFTLTEGEEKETCVEIISGVASGPLEVQIVPVPGTATCKLMFTRMPIIIML